MTGAAPARARLPVAALGFAIAAALSSWNPLSAPFGLAVGVASVGLALRALRRGYARMPSVSAVLLAAGAVVASTLVLALTAGVGRDFAGEPVVAVPPGGGAAKELDAAAERTRASRERARRELEALGPPADGNGAPGGTPGRAPSRAPGGAKGERKDAGPDGR